MRSLPTALIRTDPARRRQETAAISAITHAHRKCIDSCVAYTEIAAALLAGYTPAEAIVLAQSLSLDPEVHAALATPPATPVGALCTSGHVIDSLACAIWAVQQPTDFETTLVMLVNRGADADTTGAIAGGLLGVLAGPAGIPSRWVAGLENPAWFTAAAIELAETRK